MEFETITTQKNGFVRKLLTKGALNKLAERLVYATKKSTAAAKDVLYDLPGVFSMKIAFGGYEVRLIKEADELRIMEKSERSDILLTIEPIDAGILADLKLHLTTMQHALAEGRLRLLGKSKYAATLLRVNAEADKLLCSKKTLQKLYN